MSDPQGHARFLQGQQQAFLPAFRPGFGPAGGFSFNPIPFQGGPAWFGLPGTGAGGGGPRGGGGVGHRSRKKQRQGEHQPPNLQQLQKENKAKTKKHYRGPPGPSPPGSTRWAPRAPEHSTRVLFPTPGHGASPALAHLITPAASFGSAEKGYWRNGLGSVDPQAAEIGAAAGIDMFGSNAGLIMRGDSHEDSHDEDPFGFELHVEEAPEPGDLPTGVRQKLDEQAAYICQLEETNLKLQERIYLLEQQLGEHGNRSDHDVRMHDDGAHSDGSGGHLHPDGEDDDVANSDYDISPRAMQGPAKLSGVLFGQQKGSLPLPVRESLPQAPESAASVLPSKAQDSPSAPAEGSLVSAIAAAAQEPSSESQAMPLVPHTSASVPPEAADVQETASAGTMTG